MTALVIFTTAATCSFCGLQLDTADSDKEPLIESEGKTETDSISDSNRDPSIQTSTTSAESQGEDSSPPVIREIELFGGVDLEFYREDFESIASAEIEEIEIPFNIEAYDEDEDELAYSAYDSLGTDFDVTKTDNNNAMFIWTNPSYTGTYVLTVEVSDARGGVDTYSIDMNITDEPTYQTDNDPPQVSEIRIIIPGSGNIITANYLYTGKEYELQAIASDPEGGALYYQWSIESENGGYCGNISNASSNPAVWTTPDQLEDIIDQWCIITVRVGDNYNELQNLQRRIHVVTGSGI